MEFENINMLIGFTKFNRLVIRITKLTLIECIWQLDEQHDFRNSFMNVGYIRIYSCPTHYIVFVLLYITEIIIHATIWCSPPLKYHAYIYTK